MFFMRRNIQGGNKRNDAIMFKMSGNISSKISLLNEGLKSVDIEKIAREAAFDAMALISDRVQQRGEKTDGTKITSPSKKKYGAYSEGYGKKRNKSGREVDYIDMTFSGDMMGDFVVEPIHGGAEIGFRGDESSDKSEWNEAKFGEMFSLSDEEVDLIQTVIQNRVNEILNK